MVRATIAFAALMFFVGISLGYLMASIRYNPSCPLEDSCRADYNDGHWTIKELSPDEH